MEDNINYQDAFDISILIKKSLQGELTVEEQCKLNNWLKLDPKNKQLFERIAKKYISNSTSSVEGVDKNLAWAKVSNRIDRNFQPSYGKIAACIISLSLLVGAIYYFKNISSSQKIDTASFLASTTGNVAEEEVILTLADGEKVILNADNAAKIAQGKNTNIEIKGNSSLLYRPSAATDVNLEYNSIRTPKGLTYQITLPDDTKVWLSTDSYLKYPISFVGAERRVQLVGEAYFEVSKDKSKPFYVVANNTEIKVLGTQFNVSAYLSDNAIKTTLIEGSVRVKSGSKEVVIKPGEEVIASTLENASLRVKLADIEHVLAWKNDVFIFRDEPLSEIMKRISRWYNVDIVFEDQSTRQVLFGGKFSKNNSLDELLYSMSLTEIIKFKKDERRITIMNK